MQEGPMEEGADPQPMQEGPMEEPSVNPPEEEKAPAEDPPAAE